ncbi:sulfatase [Verrucomicrobiota bacterium]
MTNRQPNILFIFPDQHRPDWLGCNKDLPLRTPNLDRLAKRGVQFTNAFTPSPLCSPARACLATGRDYHRCGVKNNGQNTPRSLPTYFQSLRDAGYRVCGVGKFDLHKADHDQGLDGQNMITEYGFTEGIDNEGKWDAVRSYKKGDNRPSGPYMHYLQRRGLDLVHAKAMVEGSTKHHKAWVTPLPDDAYCDNWVAENAMRFLRDFPADRPWHLVVNFTGPHEPFDVTADMHEAWKDTELPPANDNDSDDPDVVLARRRHYAATIENIDRHMGRMINLVEQRAELDNTLIVYSSDHGEMLGDHGRWGKSAWYTPSSGVPLIVYGPGIRQNTRSDALVSLHDLAATFLDYAGASELPESDTCSLRGVLEGQCEKHRDYVLSGLNDWSMVFDGRYKYVIRTELSPLLYDIQEDPQELINIAQTQPHFASKLAGILKSGTGKPE